MGRATTPAAWFQRRSWPLHDDARTLLLLVPSSILSAHRWRRHNVLNHGGWCCVHYRNVLHQILVLRTLLLA